MAPFPTKAAVPNRFGTRDRFHGRQFFHGPGGGEMWFRVDSSALQIRSPPAVQPSFKPPQTGTGQWPRGWGSLY